jgi:hypothetical protein
MLCTVGLQAKIYTGFTFVPDDNHTYGTAGASSSEGPGSFVDGDRNSKWCVTHAPTTQNPIFIEFSSSVAFTPVGYILTTGNDTKTNPGRNPKNWKLKGKVNQNDATWKDIDIVTDDGNLGTENNTPYQFSISGNDKTAYRYFRFEVSAVQEGDIFQLSEIELKGYVGDFYDLTNVDVTMEEFYLCDGNNHLPEPVLKNARGETLVKNTDYTLTYSNANDAALGDYTVTVTPQSPYIGTPLVLTYTVSYKPEGISVDKDFASNQAGYYYVNIPQSGSETITISKEFNNSFRIYDHAGKSNDYANSVNGSLVLQAPEDYVIRVTGTFKLKDSGDRLTFTENTNTQLKQVSGSTSATDLGLVSSTTNNMTINFTSNNGGFSEGFNLEAFICDTHNLGAASIDGLASNYVWTGEVITPTFTVKNAAGYVVSKGDYEVSYSPAEVRNVGTYIMTITAKSGSDYYGAKVVQFKVLKALNGAGTAEDPYVINSDDDWEIFADWINNQNSTYRDKYYKLGADINVSTMVGTSTSINFGGTFDGAGHTMTLNLTANGNYCAPFRYSQSATFTRLHVAGTINTAYSTVGGITANSIRDKIYNCWSSVDINSTFASPSYTAAYGGLVGQFSLSTMTPTPISNCRFDGSINAPDTKCCAGLVGYVMGDNPSTTLINCLSAPTALSAPGGGNATLVRGVNTNTNVPVENCYYTMAFGTLQGTAVGSMTNQELRDALGDNWEISNGKVVPVMDAKNLTTGSVTCPFLFKYTGSEIDVPSQLTVKDMDGHAVAAENYEIEFSPSQVLNAGDYTLTVTGKAANGYSGSLTYHFRVFVQLPGKGTDSEPYIIDSTDDWNTFASAVAGGYTYEGEFLKLNRSIDISTVVGVPSDSPFRGTFDGAGNTLNANIVNNTPGAEGYAPFRYVLGATIKNVTVTGSISSVSPYTSGLVGIGDTNTGLNNNIINSVVTATITIGADCAGGLVGHPTSSYFYITNSVFAGTIQSNSATKRANVGALGGYGLAYVITNGALEKGTYINISSMNPRGLNGPIAGNMPCYYVNDIIGTPQQWNTTLDESCHKVVENVPTNDIYETKTICGYTVYHPATLSGLNSTYAYDYGNAINLSYTLRMGTSNLAISAFDVVIKDGNNETVAPENLKEIGTYTLHITPQTNNFYYGETVRTFRITFDLADNDSESSADRKNSALVAGSDGQTTDVTLAGRTLYKDGDWNTICLPFEVDLTDENGPLYGAEAKTLTDAAIDGTMVTLTFGNPDSATEPVTTLKAGTPYIIKWAADTNKPTLTEEDLVFTGVTIDKTDRSISKDGGKVQFIGYYDAFGITDADENIYYMTAGSTLKHTGVARTLNACRAYFLFSENPGAREFVLNFGEEETTAIAEMRKENGEMRNGAWYTVNGVRLSGKPTKKGLYIHNGNKEAIK